MTSAPSAGQESDSARVTHQRGRDIYTFDRPPVSEVVCGVGFSNPANLSIAEIGRYWAKISEEYPISRPANSLPAPGSPFPIATPFEAPRLMFTNRDGTQILQAQEGWLFLNWVRTKGSPTYPRYHAVYAAFETAINSFQAHLDERGIGRIESLLQFKLTYVNHIPKSEGWSSPDELRNYFPDFFAAWPSHRYVATPSAFSLQFSSDVSAGRLDTTIKNGRTREDPEESFVLQFDVSSPVAPKEWGTMNPWFDQAREIIVRSFFDLTSASAHELWGLHE